MPLLIDFQVLAQAVLFFTSVACGLVMSIPLGVTTVCTSVFALCLRNSVCGTRMETEDQEALSFKRRTVCVNFNGRCLLYTECTWANGSYFTSETGSKGACNFIIYSSVFAGIMFPLGMGAYYIYALSRKDPNIGAQMWVLPFVLTNSLVTVVVFIAACIISVGFKSFCDSFMSGKEKGALITSCADGQNFKWVDHSDGSSFKNSTYYAYVHASQGAAWVMFFVWACQVGLGIVRIIRNRRLRSQGMFSDSSPGTKSEDMKNVVAEEPTA